ncbi:hypothetical protein CBS63078_9700 [Aspergillus niger]|nr:hypothetical protein CBS115989_4033 [Aspergillus niger]KAI2828584.1 hypothetical protein CBS133816_5414 [Aspergillus niger]KAI2834557.1 hypothetical protein CBS11350_10629 [Aspergillus niger]KAI2845394.1 hypothetical protein CBS11232_7722 [Aspergillus niger]KAI2867213.1 hypothetical protein CBS12448_651 [Aspergillus niger]
MIQPPSNSHRNLILRLTLETMSFYKNITYTKNTFPPYQNEIQNLPFPSIPRHYDHRIVVLYPPATPAPLQG